MRRKAVLRNGSVGEKSGTKMGSNGTFPLLNVCAPGYFVNEVKQFQNQSEKQGSGLWSSVIELYTGLRPVEACAVCNLDYVSLSINILQEMHHLNIAKNEGRQRYISNI